MMVQVEYRRGERMPWRIIDTETGRTLGATDGAERDAERLAATFGRQGSATDGE